MKHIKVLGSGCANCKATYTRIEAAAHAQGIEVQLEKIEDMAQIMAHGVMSTPAVIIDDKLVHAGGIPDRQKINSWFI
ncbi:MAG: thioredoxin family protein [Thiotrichaceae bacterium]